MPQRKKQKYKRRFGYDEEIGYKNLFSNEFLNPIFDDLKIKKEDRKKISHSIWFGARNYEDIREIEDEPYLTESEQKAAIKRIIPDLKNLQKNLAFLFSDNLHYPIKNVFIRKSEEHLKKHAKTKKLPEAIFENKNYLTIEIPAYKNRKAEIIKSDDIWGYEIEPSDLLLSVINSLIYGAEKTNNAKNFTEKMPKFVALVKWLRFIGKKIEDYSPYTFTTGKYYKGAGYKAPIFIALLKVVRHLDKSINERELATAVQYLQKVWAGEKTGYRDYL